MSFLSAIRAALRWGSPPDVLATPDPVPNARPCLSHDGRSCARCRVRGVALGYVVIAPTIEAWTARAKDARAFVALAVDEHHRRAYATEAAIAWAEVAYRSGGLQRTAAIDEAVKDYLRADERAEAIHLITGLLDDVSDWALHAIGGRGDDLLLRRQARRIVEHGEHARAVIAEVGEETGWTAEVKYE